MRLGHKLFHLCPLVAGSVFFSLKVFGGNSEEVTPVPIPNTEVKLFSADGTARETVWESKTPPENLVESPVVGNDAGLFYWALPPEVVVWLSTSQPDSNPLDGFGFICLFGIESRIVIRRITTDAGFDKGDPFRFEIEDRASVATCLLF